MRDVIRLPGRVSSRLFNRAIRMRLLSNAMSPYGRKVMVVIHELGLEDRVELVDVQPRLRPDEVIAESALGKIPVLLTDSGITVKDSSVIAEYLVAEFGGHGLLPARGARRWRILTRMADADGIIEAAILVRNERLRPVEQQSASWIAWHLDKVRRSMVALESAVETFADDFDLGTISVGSAVSYVPRRLEDFEGLAEFPNLARFHQNLLERPSFARTEPQ